MLEHLRRTLGWMVLLAAPGRAHLRGDRRHRAESRHRPAVRARAWSSARWSPPPIRSRSSRPSGTSGTPRRLATLVEGESLLNDGTALVLFVVTVARDQPGCDPRPRRARTIAVTVVGSIVIGLAAGWLASRLITLVDDLAIELTISLAAAYGTYLLADGLEQSGIIATVVAGVVIGTYGPGGRA